MRTLLILAVIVFCAGCRRSEATKPASEPATPAEAYPIGETPRDLAGLHNVCRVSDKLISGGVPEGDAGFTTMEKLGVKTIISVDGAAPDIARARGFGMRYVHIPIGYDGISREQAVRLAKAVRDLPGLVYMHCHHGKHRSPAAAAVVRHCLDDRCGVEAAVEVMRRAGTDPRYVGLYAAPKQVRRPTAEELDALPADFPEVAKVSALAQMMVIVDERWDRLKLVRAAGWKVPPRHPDVVPAHEALQLREAYHECARVPKLKRYPEEMQRWLAEAEKQATALETALRPTKGGTGVDTKAAEAAFTLLADGCKQCHARYRDRPMD